MHFSSDAPADFAGLLGSSARKTVQWTAWTLRWTPFGCCSENALASPGGKSRNLQDTAVALKDLLRGGKGTGRRAAVLRGISLGIELRNRTAAAHFQRQTTVQ